MNYEGRKQVLLRVRRQYFDAIVSGEKKEELRADSKRWAWLLGDDPPDVARFTCGQDTHLRKIERIYRGNVEMVLGRLPSAQGIKDLGLKLPGPTDYPENGDWVTEAIVIELGFTMGFCQKCGGLMWRSFASPEGIPDDDLDRFGCDQCKEARPVYRVAFGKARFI